MTRTLILIAATASLAACSGTNPVAPTLEQTARRSLDGHAADAPTLEAMREPIPPCTKPEEAPVEGGRSPYQAILEHHSEALVRICTRR